MTVMRVWRAEHADGSPRKDWAVVVIAGDLVTRHGAAGQKIHGGKVKLNGLTPRERLRELEAEKRNKGYEFQGELEVSDGGEIDWSGVKHKQSRQPKVDGFFSFSQGSLARFDDAVQQRLVKAGFKIAIQKDLVKIKMSDKEKLSFIVKQGKLQCAIPEQSFTNKMLVVLLYLSSQLLGQAISPNGEIIKPTLTQRDAWTINLNAEAMELAETLELVPRAIGKLVKAEAKSGLFDF